MAPTTASSAGQNKTKVLEGLLNEAQGSPDLWAVVLQHFEANPAGYWNLLATHPSCVSAGRSGGHEMFTMSINHHIPANQHQSVLLPVFEESTGDRTVVQKKLQKLIADGDSDSSGGSSDHSESEYTDDDDDLQHTVKPSVKKPLQRSPAKSARSPPAPTNAAHERILVPYPAPADLLAKDDARQRNQREWSLREEDRAIYHYLRVIRRTSLTGEARFAEAATRLNEDLGTSRTAISFKNFWNRAGRARSRYDERKNKTAPLATSQQGKDVKVKRELAQAQRDAELKSGTTNKSRSSTTSTTPSSVFSTTPSIASSSSSRAVDTTTTSSKGTSTSGNATSTKPASKSRNPYVNDPNFFYMRGGVAYDKNNKPMSKKRKAVEDDNVEDAQPTKKRKETSKEAEFDNIKDGIAYDTDGNSMYKVSKEDQDAILDAVGDNGLRKRKRVNYSC